MGILGKLSQILLTGEQTAKQAAEAGGEWWLDEQIFVHGSGTGNPNQTQKSGGIASVDGQAPDTIGKVFAGDNLQAMAAMLPSYRKKIDLAYLDPPFLSGSDYSLQVSIPSGEGDVTKLKLPAYSDTWAGGLEAYLSMLVPRLYLIQELLSDRGSLYVHVDWRVNAYVRVLMDEIFGQENYRNEIAWCYSSPGRTSKRFKPCHDTIHYYTMGPDATWNRPQQELAAATHKVQSLKFAGQTETWTRTRHTKDMVDWWEILFQTGSSERLGYATQKPEALLNRIIEASSREGQIVFDCFAGSGTTLVAAAKLGRRFIGIDAGESAINTIRRRLVEQGIGGAELYRPQETRQQSNGQQSNGQQSKGQQSVGRTSGGAKVTVQATRYPDGVKVELTGYQLGDLSGLSPAEQKAIQAQAKWDPISMVDLWMIDPEPGRVESGPIEFGDAGSRDVVPDDVGPSDLASGATEPGEAEFIDSWPSGVASGDVFCSKWQAVRPRRKVRNPDECRVLTEALIDTPNSEIRVRVVDVLGEATTIRVLVGG